MRTSSKVLLFLFVLFAASGFAASSSIETRKLAHRFGVGVTAGGALAVLGIVADVNVTENLSIGVGLGTGLDYTTCMVQGRYFLLGEWVSPYLGLSFARWWSDGTAATSVGPSLLSERFLGAGYNLNNGFSVFLLAPALGVQFLHPMGFAVSAEVQYLFRMVDFANGTYAGMSAHWYF